MPAKPHPADTFVPFENTAIDQSISARFEQEVAWYSDRPAVVSAELQFTYAELNRVANGIARAILSHLGEGEEPVALLFEEGAFIIAAILGILKAGKIYVPLDPACPHARMAYMLENSQAGLLLTDRKHLSQAHQVTLGRQKILNCDDVDFNIATANLNRPISAEAGAIILYTSGSAGRPKGVLHSHRNILVETRNYTNDVRIGPEDRLSQCHSCSFVNSIRNIYGALLNGATLFPYDVATEGVAFLGEWIRIHRITMFHTVPTIFRRFLDTIAPDARFPAVRILRIGGEPINNRDVKRFQHHFSPDCQLMHVIGPTETLTIRRFFITHDWRSDERKVPVGYAVPDKEVVLLDETGREVGANQIGEIAVRSKYLAVGYWRQPDLTLAAFTLDSRGGGEQLYLTGDLGMMRPDGCLIHMGRKDFQVKIRGYRVEVAEIEEALLGIDSIKAAVVHPQADEAGDERLIAYVVTAASKAPTVSKLRRALAQTLPDYMVPSAFVFMDTLPLLPNGKIDRRALPAPNHARPALNVPYVAPRTPTESDLARIWAEVLGLEQVGVHDNFLELGGDSLVATRILSRVVKTFRVELSIPALFDAPTVAQMAELIAPQ
ncbi:MAG TPA: non-ribosomal peptide synthetase [Methylomirabilota bacterium]|nr:non-ribosomal peptide synthetase [Methylomirabilota bacterium]